MAFISSFINVQYGDVLLRAEELMEHCAQDSVRNGISSSSSGGSGCLIATILTTKIMIMILMLLLLLWMML